MEEKEKEVVIISKEEVEKVINTLNQAEEVHPEINDSEPNTDLGKVKEVIASLEGCTAQTVVGILSTAMLLLPAGAIMAVLDMGKSALKAKTFAMLMSLVGKDHESNEEAPKE